MFSARRTARGYWVVNKEVILVHEYLDIDREIVYDVLQERLGDFGELRKAFGRFL